MKLTRLVLIAVCLFPLFVALQPALCWSNGGYSADPTHPDYGTHDWIAQHALNYLPAQEKQYITDNLASYLYGTELPDRPSTQGGIGDTTKHHVYYSSTGALVDDASAKRAQSLFDSALNFLKADDYVNASRTAGTMTHYIADLAVFGHVMGTSTPWGTETHHSDYENYVTDRTTSYQSTFNSYLSFDGGLTSLSAYNATVNLAYDTTFGGSSQLTCVWMDTHYDWSNAAFSGRCGESLNLAINSVADVLHTLYLGASPTPSPSPIPTATPTATPTPTPTDTPATTPTPTASTPNPTTSTTNVSTSTPTATPTPPTTPTVSEFPLTLTIITAILSVLSLALIYLKKKAPLNLRLDVC